MNAEETKRFETPDALRHDATTLADEARALMDATAEIADDKIKAARDRLNEALSQGRNQYARIRERASAGAKVADQAVRSHPYESVGIAFGVGLLVGFLVTRRS